MNITEINNHFKLPITYINKYSLKENIIEDLELQEYKSDPSFNIYTTIFDSSYNIFNQLSPIWNKLYTSNTPFLKQQQNIIKKHNNFNFYDFDNLQQIYNKIHNNQRFLSDFNYFDHQTFQFVNNSKSFLFYYSCANILSPLINLSYPIFFIIVPFFIIKFIQKKNISFELYINILKEVAKNHTLGKLLTLSNANLNSKIFIIFSTIFYFYTTYNNILSCINHHNNFYFIFDFFNSIKKYLQNTLNNITHFIKISNKNSCFKPFLQNLHKKEIILCDYYTSLNKFNNNFTYNHTISNMGDLLLQLYKFKFNTDIKNAFLYSIGFNYYSYCLFNLNKKIKDNNINLTTFTDKNKFKIKKLSNPVINNSVKNNIEFKNNYIITGPNASGKTTIIKSTTLAIIFSQQFGCGFFQKCYLKPYNYIHCYLNIPDTSGRDSLFQAEARRCKNIIDELDTENRHFCIFDELFSGTNPYEAVASAYSFLLYIQNYNVNIMLTTHYIQLCKLINNNKFYSNYHMNCKYNLDNTSLTYKYTISKNISDIKGGVQVLIQLDYPQQIVQNTLKVIKNI
jgi:hypothetical protein